MKKNKIGIITFHNALNTGAVLQAYALQQYLKAQGYKVEFINYLSPKAKITWRNFISKSIFNTVTKWQDIFYRNQYKNNFNKILKVNERKYYSTNELNANPPEYDIYIAGSDQIWNFGFSKKFNPAYLLNFGGDEIRRIAFSASMGQTNQPKEIEGVFKKHLKKFDFISVREKNGFEYIKSLLGDNFEIDHIADPTFLIKKDDYLNIAERNNEPQEFMISYILPHYEFPKQLFKVINIIEEKLKYKLINLKNPDTCLRLPNKKNLVVDPQKWLAYFINSKFNICCSFHAVVFSLIFHKPFVVVSPYKNQRIISLLEPLNLLDRCIYTNNEELIERVLEETIDWDLVDNHFLNERKKAINFLNKSLK